jgi:hypothetical protein
MSGHFRSSGSDTLGCFILVETRFCVNGCLHCYTAGMGTLWSSWGWAGQATSRARWGSGEPCVLGGDLAGELGGDGGRLVGNGQAHSAATSRASWAGTLRACSRRHVRLLAGGRGPWCGSDATSRRIGEKKQPSCVVGIGGVGSSWGERFVRS